MDPRTLSPQFAVLPQITPQDIPALKAQGYRAIIANRPDGEGADQPTFAEIETAAHAAGMQARYIPISGGMVGDDDVEAFRSALRAMPGPVLAYCRSGTRSIVTWALGQAQGGGRDRAELVALGAAAGYDLDGVLG